MRMFRQSLINFAAVPLLGMLCFGFAMQATATQPTSLRLNELQYIGSHNSYHAGLGASEAVIWKRIDPATFAMLDYAHPRLTRQLDDGVHQLELDVYGDAKGGRYAHPVIDKLVRQAGLPPDPPFADHAVMQRPGFKVMHIQDLDQRSQCQPLTACLAEIRAWSLAHPTHLPIFILVETVLSPARKPYPIVEPEPFDTRALDALDAEIRSVFSRQKYISPDDVRGQFPTLNAAIRKQGWPTLQSARGKVIFLLDQRWVGPAYLQGHPSLRGRVFFTNAVPGADDAAFTELNDGDADSIAKLVKHGYLVRTRTDADLKEAARNDTTRRDAMLASGAQLLSTDYPDGEPAATGYVVSFPGHLHARCDPLFVQTSCTSTDLSETTHAKDKLQLERVILLYRHGVRTPLPGEIQLNDVTGKPWPTWAQPPSELTPHGAAGARRMGQYDRQRLAAAGLFPRRGCPAPRQLWFWANTDQRTIASAQALAEGFAPGCNIAIGHLTQGSEDPLFHPIEAGATEWNAQQAVASIQASTGGADALMAFHRDALATMAHAMGCGTQHDPAWCTTDQWHGSLAVSPDHRHLLLTGPIDQTSGTAEAILMAYAEGRSMHDVGWGRVTPAQLEQLSQLHALLFDIYARPDYMAERVASVMRQKILHLLEDDRAPRLSVMVGSDNNIIALASVLGLHFKMPGYAKDDPPIGGALGIELWRNPANNQHAVRVFYQAQSLAQLRSLPASGTQAAPATQTLELPGCAPDEQGRCALTAILSRLHQ